MTIRETRLSVSMRILACHWLRRESRGGDQRVDASSKLHRIFCASNQDIAFRNTVNSSIALASNNSGRLLNFLPA